MKHPSRQQVNTRKHRKLALVLLAPVFFFTFIIGWLLYYNGRDKTKQVNVKALSEDKDNIKLIMIPQEEEILTT